MAEQKTTKTPGDLTRRDGREYEGCGLLQLLGGASVPASLGAHGVTCPTQTGGGRVNDSEPKAEFQETVNQSKAIHSPQ